MDEGRAQDPLFTVTVFFLTDVGDIAFLRRFFAQSKDEIGDESDENAAYDFDSDEN